MYGHHTDRLRKNCNSNDFAPFYFKLDNFNVLKILLWWDFKDHKVNPIYIVLQNSCNWNTYVTLQGNEYELPEDDTVASKHAGAW